MKLVHGENEESMARLRSLAMRGYLGHEIGIVVAFGISVVGRRLVVDEGFVVVVSGVKEDVVDSVVDEIVEIIFVILNVLGVAVE